MLALASAWIGLSSLILAIVMLVYRPAMADWAVTLVLYFGSPGALCLAIIVLWAYRGDDSTDPALAGQRLQAKIAIVLAIVAAGIVYALIIGSQKLLPAD